MAHRSTASSTPRGVAHAYAPAGPYTATISVEGCPPLEITVGPLDPCVGRVPIGACCLPNGQCVEVTEAECLARKGTYQGDGTACATTDCSVNPPPPPGGGGPAGCKAVYAAHCGPAGIAISLGLVAITLNCLGVPVPPIIWGFIGGIAAAAVLALGVWALLCRLKICTCPTTCDLLAIVWISFLSGAIVAAYLFGCCPLMGAFVATLGGIALLTLLTWVLRCFDMCTILIDYLMIAFGTGAGSAFAVLMLLPVISACGVSLVDTIAGIVTAGLIVLSVACH